MAYRDVILADNPLAYYPLDDAAGSTTAVDVAHGLTATVTGSVTFGQSPVITSGTSVAISGNPSGLILPADPSLAVGTADWSVEAWLVVSSSSNQIFCDPGGGQYIGLIGGKLSFSGSPGTVTVTDGQRHHLVVTRTNGTIDCYVDGQHDGGAANQTFSATFASFFYWKAQNSFTTVGKGDDPVIFGYALTPAKIGNHYTAGTTAPSNTSPTVSSVSISPATPTVNGGSTQQFTATVSGTNSPGQGVTWTASVGSINSSGLFTAPAATSSAQSATITATSTVDTTKSGSTTATIPASTATTSNLAPAGNLVVVSATPTTITLKALYSGGNNPVGFQWQRAKVSDGNFTVLSDGSGVSGSGTATLVDGSPSLVAGTLYMYRCTVDDKTKNFVTYNRPVMLGLPPLTFVAMGDSQSNGIGGGAEPLNSAIYHAAQTVAQFSPQIRNITVVNGAVSGTYSDDWTSTASGSNFDNTRIKAGGNFNGMHIFLRFGANDDQRSENPATTKANYQTICTNCFNIGAKAVFLSDPLYRDPGLYGQDGSSVFGDNYLANVLATAPAIDSLVNGTTIFAGDRVSLYQTMQDPQDYMYYAPGTATTTPGTIHPAELGTQLQGLNEGLAWLRSQGLLGTGSTTSGLTANQQAEIDQIPGLGTMIAANATAINAAQTAILAAIQPGAAAALTAQFPTALMAGLAKLQNPTIDANMVAIAGNSLAASNLSADEQTPTATVQTTLAAAVATQVVAQLPTGTGTGTIVGTGGGLTAGQATALSQIQTAVTTTGVMIHPQGLTLVDMTDAAHGVAPNFQQRIHQLWRRLCGSWKWDGAFLKTYSDDGTTMLTNQTYVKSSNGTTQGPLI